MKHLIAASILSAAVAALPVTADPIAIQTAQGVVELEQSPGRLAVFDVAAIDTLHALGIMPDAVPGNLYVDYLEEVTARAAPVGTLFEPDLEALANIGPDLIVVGGRSAVQAEPLSALAPVIDMTIWKDVVAEARARITIYGALFGKQKTAAELTTRFDAKLAQLRAAAADNGKALVVLTNGPKISAYGKGSRFGWIHSSLGIAEAYENLDPATHGDAISFEFIAETNPDWLIVIDRGSAVGADAVSAQATLDNPLVAGTKAWSKGRVVYLKAANVYIAGGGYTSLTGTMDELLTAFSK